MSPRVGETLSGRYRLQRLIATGGMGQVWEAVDSRLGRRVAVKVLKQEFSSDPEFLERFRAEARTVAMLNHPGIAAVHDYGETEIDGEGRTAYLVMELINGEPLNSVLKRTGRLSLRHALDMLEQTGRALQVAHAAGLVHRDVKPGNLLVMQDGRVKVLDLGLAGSQLEEESSRIGRVIGTMDYIAPEQIRAPDDVGPAADIYALGCTLYYAVTGRVPFPGGSRKEKMQRHLTETPDAVRTLAPQLSDAFCRLIDDMMAKTVEKRIGSAAGVVERLRPWLPDGPSAGGRGSADPAGQRMRVVAWPPPLPRRPGNAGMPDAPSTSSTFGGSDSLSESPTEADVMGSTVAGGVRSLGRRLGRAVMVAVPGGIAVGWGMRLVRLIDPDRFDTLFRGTSPTTFGWCGFLLVLVVVLATATEDRDGG